MQTEIASEQVLVAEEEISFLFLIFFHFVSFVKKAQSVRKENLIHFFFENYQFIIFSSILLLFYHIIDCVYDIFVSVMFFLYLCKISFQIEIDF